jgi:hypothetical protein
LGDDFIVWEEVILIGGGNHLILRPKISDEQKKK